MTPLPASQQGVPLLPWQEGPALFEWLLSIPPGQSPLPPLPDGCRYDAQLLLFGEEAPSSSLSSSSGSSTEQIALPTAGEPSLDWLAMRVLELLCAATGTDGDDDKQSKARTKLYQLARNAPLLALADPLTEAICAERGELDAGRLAELARWLVRRAAHRGALKLGLVLLGLVGESADVPDLVQIARHDEFTLFAAVAAGRILDEPCDAWWAMAQRNHGAGRVVVVERLATYCTAERADVRRWLLHEGIRVDGFEAELALHCARGARLAAVLAVPSLPHEDVGAACEIMRHLLRGTHPHSEQQQQEPPPIAGYAEARFAIAHLLRHLTQQPAAALVGAEVALLIRAWLKSDHAHACTSEALRRTLTEHCETLLSRSHWLRLVSTAVQAGSEAERLRAFDVAAGLGLDLWDETVEHFHFEPLTAAWVRRLAVHQPRKRLQRLVYIGRDRLPHTEIATGPAETLRLDDPELAPHAALDAVLHVIAGDVGTLYEPRVVATAMQSPVVRNRYAALAILKAVPRPRWGSQVEHALRKVREQEPDAELAEQWKQLGT